MLMITDAILFLLLHSQLDFIIFFFQTSDSVTLDLLTYADLELLRNRKAGVVSRPRGHQQSSALTAKRYLILIYTVEFDRCVVLT